MSGFLANLAGLALGQPPAGAARLSLPPRFSGSAAMDTDADLERVDTTPAGEMSAPLSAQPSEPSEIRKGQAVTESVKTVQVPTSPSPERQAHPTASPIARENVFQKPIEFVALDHPLPTKSDAAHKGEPVRSEPETTFARLDAPIRSEMTVRHIGSDPSSLQAAPLTQAALANRSVVRREPPPVVNVTIDRLEVLTPREATQPQTPRRARPQPSVSLADYLGTRS